MNAYIERLNGSIRREALDHFLLLTGKQIRNIVSEYIEYYNQYRPHQGLNGIPDGGFTEQGSGVIKKRSFLSGLHLRVFRRKTA